MIKNDTVEICETFKYLGVTIGNKLSRSKHCATVVSQCKQRLCLLGLLNSFYVNSEILHIFYTLMIESVICHNITLWWYIISCADKAATNRICKQATKIIKTDILSIEYMLMYVKYVLKKVKCVVYIETNPLHKYFSNMRSGTRLRTSPQLNSFV